MPTVFDFERPVIELESKIAELKSFANEKGLSLETEIGTLEQRASELKQFIYGNLTPWQKVLIARHPERPGSLEYIEVMITDFEELCGDRLYGDDAAIVGGIGRFEGRPVTVVGHRKGRDTKENLARNFGMAHPEGYRKALRLMKQAEKFDRPLICFIDTPGAHCGLGAEQRGQAEAIAKNIMVMSALKIPIIVLVIGEGGSGGALALSVGDRILMQEHSVFSVSSPEACASIIWKDSARARDAAEVLKLTAHDLLGLKIADDIISEPLGGAHRDKEEATTLLISAVSRTMAELTAMGRDQLLDARYQKFRKIGVHLVSDSSGA
ncbi:MAG: acetyl-CoA carboxylase carboxyltransferase subunit alpha [Eubacteriales bacterium]|nr:acetyl-CoA carboxylase carboxyltransferase subunit alpha [Bacillota bacterium]MBV1727300.1 acetyl-CoA carboxylase carboxyltransferase subunit alpha [Desulforudis sp.]MDQ7789304.1 acetyl-CoA carboxylase carboxyltransferase subunit alpha [Clostridia bacterium]MDZ4043116.1 acetyl-CoA carboxylase carboxyltransferase subunit alpha [Eubacteriales bacterium]MBU4555003.1 acetyl-CoA carboxylase carboxyltransferase subunit alpha [Bacillota bacterium]